MIMITLPPPAQNIIKTLNKAGYQAYAVGGSVRDLLLNRQTKGWDFTTDATPKEIMKVFPNSFYDNDFGTVGVKIENEKGEITDVYEITTFRSETVYKDFRHPEKVIWGKSILEDLSRRDLTINAIATDLVQLIDPYNGQKDLQDKIIRTVGDPNRRFTEDALRLMRAVRIATELGFMIEEKTFASIRANAHLITNISVDRIRHELMQILDCTMAADGILLLKNVGLLTYILPELEKAFTVEQKSPKRHHIYNVGTHLIESLRYCPSKDPIVRFATLLHDIGKPVVFRKNPKTNLITFYNHEVVGAEMVKNILRRLNFSKKNTDKIYTLVRWHQFSVDETQTDAALRRFIRRVGKENLQDMIDLRIGDRLGGGARETSWRLRLFLKRLEEVQKQPFTVADLKVNGHDVMQIFGIGPGPLVGKVLDELFNEVITNKIKNDRQTLRARLKKLRSLTQPVN